MRLDIDFWHDEKFAALIHDKGKAAAFDAIRLYCLASAKSGCLDLTDRITAAWVESELGVKGKRLKTLMESLAEYEIISADELKDNVITSERLMAEGSRVEEIRQRRKDAANKRWDANA